MHPRTSSVRSPSNYDEVLTVTAMNDYDGAPGGNAAPRCAAPSPNPDDAPASYSNYTTDSELAHTVAAPGTCLQSLYPGDRYVQSLLGTSLPLPTAPELQLCASPQEGARA
jgi:hypothetical protein